ncbi:MAG: methyltransferase domain-containing protein [Caldithrix sp.]|nr:methyltransferase domain-containing protein [Caldithrix sp.]
MGQSANQFYQTVSRFYDQMTGFEKRLHKEKEIMQKWVERYRCKTALDAACGTGLHTIVLNQLGITATGADLSREMLQQARQNSEALGLSIAWLDVPMQDLSDHTDQEVDILFCLGNSIPHLLSTEELERTFSGFRKLVRPVGILAIQILNYENILKNAERIVGIKKAGGHTFVRFYDFLQNTIRFNILSIEEDEKGLHHTLSSTELYPYRWQELQSFLDKAGFHTFELYGDMLFSEYHPDHSSNLVIVAY